MEPASPIKKYTKKMVLDYLKENGCTHENLVTTARARRNNTNNVIDFFCRSSEDAEVRVNQAYDSVSLKHINQWLEVMKSANLSTLCEYEAAAVMNAIVRHEEQPDPEQLGGVNMGEVYGFLENALAGQPQKKLSVENQTFLHREIELLISEANNDEADDAAQQMGQSLYKRTEYNYEEAPHKCSLDPLFVDE